MKTMEVSRAQWASTRVNAFHRFYFWGLPSIKSLGLLFSIVYNTSPL